MKRFYDLDVMGRVRGSYANSQEGLDLVLLEEQPNDKYYWNGTVWIYDLDKGKTEKLSKIRTDAKMIIEAKYPIWYQTNVANAVYSEAVGIIMKTAIASIITESNRCEDLVDASTTEVEVDAVTPNWPVF